MLKIYTGEVEWNNVVKSFPNWSVYYLYGYCKSLQIHGDGKPLLVYFEANKFRLCYAVMENDISDSEHFKYYIRKDLYFDWSTPYGYGGPIIDGLLDTNILNQFFQELKAYCYSLGIVSQFVRFCPWMQNHVAFEKYMIVKRLKETVLMDITSEAEIYSNLDSKNRNMVRKAINSGVKILSDQGENIDHFIYIYNQTMKYNCASKYYYFSENYYEILQNCLKDNIKFFYAVYQEQFIGATIILFDETMMHYHLSGLLSEFRHLASGNLLLYEAALWGCRKRIKQFHLGGGVNQNDSLFCYKKGFCKRGIHDFYVGCNIFDKEKERYLIEIRKTKQVDFNDNNQFLIKYRG